MGKTVRILRTSIFSFLQNYQQFTSTPTLLTFPFAVSTLLSQSLIATSSLSPLVHGRLNSLFLAAGFPPSSELFAILNLKLSQTILTFIFVQPFTLSFLLLAKASIITSLEFHKQINKKHSIVQRISLFNSLFITQLCNSLIILSANATCFSLLIIYFNFFDTLGFSSAGGILLLSATGAVIYSIILANAYIICNLALILSGKEKKGGFMSIMKTCVLIRSRTATALSLAVLMNITFAGIEALFQYRVVRAYNRDMGLNSSMVMESMLIAYLYAMLLVLDTVVGFVFLKSCGTDYQSNDEDEDEEDIIYFHPMEKVKDLEFLP